MTKKKRKLPGSEQNCIKRNFLCASACRWSTWLRGFSEDTLIQIPFQTELLWQSKKRTVTVPIIHERWLPLPAPESPSSPRLAIPTKKTLPSSATIRAWALSWPVATCTILGDLVMGSSAHFPGAGPPCLMPSDAALPEYRTWVGKQNYLRSTGNSGWVKKETSKKNELQRFCGTWEYSMCQCTHVHTIHMRAHTHTHHIHACPHTHKLHTKLIHI